MAEVMTPQFWTALLTIIWINIILSGDNAVVIALAARSLPERQQKQAVLWGAGAAVLMRIVLTIVAVELLRFPWLKLIGAVLLLWIAVKLLMPEKEHGEGIDSSANLFAAIKTILIADLVMSLDNVIAVAAAAKGSTLLLIIGLAISIPLVIFGATMLMKVMERWPIIITAGAAILGWVAGEMGVTDPVLVEWVDENAKYLHWIAPAAGVIFVVVLGKWLARRAEKERVIVDLAGAHARTPPDARAVGGRSEGMKVLIPVDGSDSSARAIDHLLKTVARMKEAGEIHLLNVQPPLPSQAASHGSQDALKEHHQEEGMAALGRAMQKLDAAGVEYVHHIAVGGAAEVITRFAKEQGCDQILMGTRGMGAAANVVMGSVATQVVDLADVPVILVK